MQDYSNMFNVPELNKRLFFTFIMFVVFRLAAHIPTPGVDTHVLATLVNQNQSTALGLFNLFSGGAISNFSIVSLGIMPYISAAIILELFTAVSPELAKLKKEGESGRRKISEYTRYLTVIISLLQGIGIAIGLQSMHGPNNAPVVIWHGIGFIIFADITLTTGTVFLMWIGEQITERGIGNGISLIIFAGIIARLPAAIGNTFNLVSSGDMSILALLLIFVVVIGVIALIIFVELAQRRVTVQYPRRMVGKRLYNAQSSYIPLKINVSGVIPPIFASSIMLFPATIAKVINVPFIQKISNWLNPGGTLYNVFYVILIFFFAYFYTSIAFNPKDVADNLKKNGGFIPGIRPGKYTADFLDWILTRLTFVGGIYLSFVCVLPWILMQHFSVPFYFGGTAVLIVVQVALDTIMQIQAHLYMRNYDGFLKKGGK
ncbi:MAG: preprotein translocase subunit SecY [Desulfurella sp.]|jgi:preprotein translocase subunit SecY|uniref:preprotein translocase subunit SecY n=1 Tax=Desulfurella TaxID=33001 RepID=UPI0004AFF156|nr:MULTISPECIES: preprotein translocase subunit SecY [Desulfurella]